MTRIAEAYSDENGKARGGEPGDQTGQEIKIREWYERPGGWSVYLECTDPVLAQEAAFNMELIAETDMALSTVAMMCGFRSLRTFNRVFRDVRGCTPTQYRLIYDESQRK